MKAEKILSGGGSAQREVKKILLHASNLRYIDKKLKLIDPLNMMRDVCKIVPLYRRDLLVGYVCVFDAGGSGKSSCVEVFGITEIVVPGSFFNGRFIESRESFFLRFDSNGVQHSIFIPAKKDAEGYTDALNEFVSLSSGNPYCVTVAGKDIYFKLQDSAFHKLLKVILKKKSIRLLFDDGTFLEKKEKNKSLHREHFFSTSMISRSRADIAEAANIAYGIFKKIKTRAIRTIGVLQWIEDAES